MQSLSGKIYKYHSLKVGTFRSNLYSHLSNIKQYTFLAFLALFELGSLLCGVSISSRMFIVGRAVAGAGGSEFSVVR
jgi:hypothetical protein